MLDSAAAIAVFSGPELRFELANATCRNLMPRPDLDPVGRRYEEVWPSGGPVAVQALRRVRDTGEPCRGEDHALADGGRFRRFSSDLKAVPWRGGVAVLAVLWETTALCEGKRRAEEAAQRALRRVSELEAQAAELQDLEAARDDLVRMVSHDLRTPLNAILAQAHLLRLQSGDPARVEERGRSIARSCRRMRSMIEDLLEATLLEAGQLRIAPKQIDLAAFTREVIERHRGALAVERVRLELSPSVPARSDPERLERVLVNLVSNALKYSPPQGEVTVRVEAVDGGATLSVTDRGVGIAPEDLPHVFERFFRSRGARQPEGLGLGLYISRLLVYAHGGRIDVESQLGCGSTFRVFLPGAPPLPGWPPAP